MSYVASALREKHSEDKLHILSAKTNSDSFTYDGIDLGAERVTQETETYIKDLEAKGTRIRKLSVVGYSLGGLVARYVMGLLYSRGWFNQVKPVNFTTFATPHLGVRTPVLGVHSQVWNYLGASTLSISGRQLFTIDTFRDTGRPLLSILADPESIFVLALSCFQNRVLYANIVNDRSAPYYTTSISRTDPFTNINTLDLNYLPNYKPNILVPTNPITVKPQEKQPPLVSRLASSTQTIAARAPLFALLTVLIPIGSVVFFINSGIQSVRSQQRIRLHEQGKAGIGLGSYRIPMMVENARSTVEGALENISRTPTQNSLIAPDEQTNGHAEKARSKDQSTCSSRSEHMKQIEGFPTLALSSEQFAMIEALDDVGFKKYRVHIHKVGHSHAAIVVRTTRKGFDEGKVIIRHWLDEEFEI
ncbi:MAG: hypothetical protein Q9164_006806 [Protoblastenia rupestris]